MLPRALLILFSLVPVCLAITLTGEYGHTSVVVNNVAYIFGGYSSSDPGLSTLYALDLSASWNINSPPFENRTDDGAGQAVPRVSFHTAFPSADGKSFYIFGGGRTPYVPNSTFFAQYDTATRQWKVNPGYSGNLPSQRRELAAVWTSSGKVFLWAGLSDMATGFDGKPTPSADFGVGYSDVVEFDTAQSSWSSLVIPVGTPGKPPFGRILYSATMLGDGRILYIGGRAMYPYNATLIIPFYVNMTDIPIFDSNKLTWVPSPSVTGATLAPRVGHVAGLAPDGKNIAVFGGMNATTPFSDLGVLDTTTFTWSIPAVKGTAPLARFSPSAVVVNGQMIIMFGYNAHPLNDTAILSMTGASPSDWQWVDTFTPTSKSSGLQAIGGIGGLVGIIIGGLVLIGLIIFLIIKLSSQKVPIHTRYAPMPYPPTDAAEDIPKFHGKAAAHGSSESEKMDSSPVANQTQGHESSTVRI